MDNSKQPSPRGKARFNFFRHRQGKAAPAANAPAPAGENPAPGTDQANRKRENTIVTQTPFKHSPSARQTPLARQAVPAVPENSPVVQEGPYIPKITDFETFNFHPSIMEGIRALGYTAPTPIQEQAIPVVLQGRDIIGLAQTGTGKTAAFVLPIIQRLVVTPKRGTRVLVISPTRELAEQTCDVFNNLGRRAGLRALAIYGGTSMSMQNDALRGNPAIVVACPGRLLDHLWKGSISLANLDVLVIDEADRMFDMGFLPDIRNILKCIMGNRQTLLFSATMPEDIRRLVKEFLTDPVTIQIGRTLPAETVSHAIYPVGQHLKSALLAAILRKIETESVLIFTRTKRRAEKVAEMLYRDGHRVGSLQGDLTQSQRQIAIDGFRNGKIKILVATDIASRGIDILRISHVINYDMPESTDDYIHRIGRTGRVEKSGEALTLVTTEDASKIRDLEKILKKPLQRVTLEGFDYNQIEHDHTTKPRRPRQTYKGGPTRKPAYKQTVRR
jgi:ATP-dependent RNA helicase RhlE